MAGFRLNLGPRRVERDVDAELAFHLDMRVQRLVERGMDQKRVAALEILRASPKIPRVFYSGLPDDPDHDVAQRLLPRGPGGMLAFELQGGRAAVDRLIAAMRMIRFAPSLADVATTLSHPASTSHRALDADERRALGIGDGLVRLSAGIEAADDICADLARGLEAL